MNIKMDTIQVWLVYRGAYHYLGKKFAEEFRERKQIWLRGKQSSRVCESCGIFLKFRQRTIDHIIPKSLIYELEEPKLLDDPNNWWVMCKWCNSDKSNLLPEVLPQKTLDFMASLGYYFDKQNLNLVNTEISPLKEKPPFPAVLNLVS